MKLVDQLYQRIRDLEQALERCAVRFEDVAEITEKLGGYYNTGFYRMSARRCRNVVAGGKFDDEPTEAPSRSNT